VIRLAKVNKSALVEAVKEPLRLLVLAVIPFGIAWLGGLPYEGAIVVTVALKFLDKFFHQLGKNTDRAGLIKGITRF